jgi:hypothetical protein
VFSSSLEAPVWQGPLGVDMVGRSFDMDKMIVGFVDKIKDIFGRKGDLDCNDSGRYKNQKQIIYGIGERFQGSEVVYVIEGHSGVSICVDLVNNEQLLVDFKN